MNIQELDKKTMTAMETLAQTNVKIGEAKGILENLKLTEMSYLEEREKTTIVKIQSILDESEVLVSKIKGNYEEISTFYANTCTYVEFLSEIQKKIAVTIESFNQNVTIWEESVKKEENRLFLLRRDIDIQEKKIEIDKKTLDAGFKKLANESKLIESRQAQLSSALKIIEKKKNG